MLKLTFYKTHRFQGMVGSEWDDTFFWLPLRDQKEWTKGGATWKWILTIFKYLTECFKQLQQKKRWKNGVICLVFMFSSYVMVSILSKKYIFCNFVLTSATNLSLLKQFTCMYLKVLITRVSATVMRY